MSIVIIIILIISLIVASILYLIIVGANIDKTREEIYQEDLEQMNYLKQKRKDDGK